MALTFMDMVKEAQSEVEVIDSATAKAMMEADSNVLMIDVRDAADIANSGIIPGAAAISLGTLGFKADTTMPEAMQHPELGVKDRPIIMTCTLGAMASLGGKLLQDMGYTNVKYLAGGTNAWKETGFAVDEFGGS